MKHYDSIPELINDCKGEEEYGVNVIAQPIYSECADEDGNYELLHYVKYYV